MNSLRKQKDIRAYSVEILEHCIHGVDSVEVLDELFKNAEIDHEKNQIFNSKLNGTGFLQFAAKNGNYLIMEWFIEKCKFEKRDIEINAFGADGFTPLLAVCQKGF